MMTMPGLTLCMKLASPDVGLVLHLGVQCLGLGSARFHS